MAAAKSGSDGPPLHPELGTVAAVELAVLREEPNVVAHSDPTREPDVPVRELGVIATGRSLREREETRNALVRDPNHSTSAAAPAAAVSHAWGCWHTGQYTAA